MMFGSADTDGETFRNVRIVAALRQQSKDLALPRCKSIKGVNRPPLGSLNVRVYYAVVHGWAQITCAIHDLANSGDEATCVCFL